MYNTKYKVTLC